MKLCEILNEQVTLFGKRDKESRSIDILVDGEVIGQITSSSYDRLMRRSTGGGYETSFSYKGKRFIGSDMVLQDLKRRIIKWVEERK